MLSWAAIPSKIRQEWVSPCCCAQFRRQLQSSLLQGRPVHRYNYYEITSNACPVLSFTSPLLCPQCCAGIAPSAHSGADADPLRGGLSWLERPALPLRRAPLLKIGSRRKHCRGWVWQLSFLLAGVDRRCRYAWRGPAMSLLCPCRTKRRGPTRAKLIT